MLQLLDLILNVFRYPAPPVHTVQLGKGLRYRGYKPQPLTFFSALRWLNQFEEQDHLLAEQLLDNVIYLSESMTLEILVNQNSELMRRLNGVGLPAKKLIYVSFHEAGSSSPVMLNLLRDSANLGLVQYERGTREKNVKRLLPVIGAAVEFLPSPKKVLQNVKIADSADYIDPFTGKRITIRRGRHRG